MILEVVCDIFNRFLDKCHGILSTDTFLRVNTNKMVSVMIAVGANIVRL
jgi:hypothetical protein